MGQHFAKEAKNKNGLDQQFMNIGKNQQQLYKGLRRNLSDLFRIYKEYENSGKASSKMTALKKYRLVRKSLQKDFENDADMARYIRRLPNMWILIPYAIEVMLLLSIIGVYFVNQIYLKIFIGVFLGRLGDAIYFFTSLLFALIYMLLFHKRVRTHNALIENLSQIWHIVEKETKKINVTNTNQQ